MTRSESREVDLAKKYHSLGYPEIAARSLSAVIRSTRSKATSDAVRVVATVLGVANHPEFII